MGESNEDRLSTSDEFPLEPLLPPLPGECQRWFSLYPFPLTATPDKVLESIAPWFRQFSGKSQEDVAKLLEHQWSSLQPAALESFAKSLQGCHPFGILHSKHPDGQDNVWLVLSRQMLPPEARGWIESGSFYDELYYLAAPLDIPPTFTINPNDTKANFFLNFGGLRQSPPFQAGHFYRFPMAPVEIETGEWEKFSGTEWEGAEGIYVSDVGDELLISTSGKLGWILHEDRSIQPMADSIEELLEMLSCEYGLSAVSR